MSQTMTRILMMQEPTLLTVTTVLAFNLEAHHSSEGDSWQVVRTTKSRALYGNANQICLILVFADWRLRV